jgi:hypothetical protein
MPDLLGPNPCDVGCEWGTGVCQGAARRWYEKNCLIFQRWDARRALLEALKAGGVKVDAGEEWTLRFKDAQYAIELKYAEHPGHLIFIPEAQP